MCFGILGVLRFTLSHVGGWEGEWEICGGTSDVQLEIMSSMVDDILALGCKNNFQGMYITVTLEKD